MGLFMIKPARQGHLDNFCGIYSIVNAVSYLYPTSLNRKNLCLKLINQFHQQHDVIDLINYGMSHVEVDELIANVLNKGYYKKRYPLKITTPYRNKKGIRVQTLLDEITQFLNRNNQVTSSTAVILATQHHWSVVTVIDSVFIHFFDSAGIEKAYKRSFSLKRSYKTYYLDLNDIYFLECEL